MQKCDFNKVKSHFDMGVPPSIHDVVSTSIRRCSTLYRRWNDVVRLHGSPAYLLHIFRTPFYKNIYEGLLVTLSNNPVMRMIQ